MLFPNAVVACLIVGVMAFLLVTARRARAAAERAMCLEAIRSDALGRLARGDPMDQILGVLAATIHISYPVFQCSIRVGAEWVPGTPPLTAFPIEDRDGRRLGSLVIEQGPAQVQRDPASLISRVTDLAAIVIEHKTLHRQLEYEASHDWLTGLANRRMFMEKINSLGATTPATRKAAIFFIDLDRFKEINDGFGHHIGDLFLREAGLRIQSCFSSADLVARMGGDEFTVFAEGLAAQDVAKTCARVIDQFRRPFSLGGVRFLGSASIGVSSCPDDGPTAAVVQRNADRALYEAKEQGRNQFRVYMTAMRQREELRRQTDQIIRQALDDNLFELFYQPQVDGADSLVGLEALVRIRHPERGLIMPENFIVAAEERGLIAQIDSWVLAEACRQQTSWHNEGFDTVRIAVNISRSSLADPDLPRRILATLDEAGVPPSKIQIEVTETAAHQGGDIPRETLQTLHDAGISIALDDFGTGSSSLSCLHNLPVDTVKIDQSFVRQLTDGPHARLLVQAIVGVAKALNLTTVAEGIETESQASLMRSLGCDVLQGFLISMPVAVGEIDLRKVLRREDTLTSVNALRAAIEGAPQSPQRADSTI